MIKTCSLSMVCALCLVFAMGCKKKPSGTAPAAGSGSAMAGSGSAMAGSAMEGSGSAMAGSGSAEAGSAGSAGSAMEGSGSAMEGSGSAAAGSAEAGSAAGSGSSAMAEDPEGKRHWNCKKECKLALHCKSSAGFHNAKECDMDCTNLAKDKDGRYARGSVEGAAFYTCLEKATDCAAVTACGKH